jgi:hypothetical protein
MAVSYSVEMSGRYRIDKIRVRPDTGMIEVFRYDDNGELYRCGMVVGGRPDEEYRLFYMFFIDCGGPEWEEANIKYFEELRARR